MNWRVKEKQKKIIQVKLLEMFQDGDFDNFNMILEEKDESTIKNLLFLKNKEG